MMGTGVDAIHVWAYPDPGSGVPPVFVGTPTYGGPRGDVGAAFGDARFTASGYSLSVNTLASGTYDLVVYTHSTVTNTFNNYRVVRITVP
jgi:hypothetical protein